MRSESENVHNLFIVQIFCKFSISNAGKSIAAEKSSSHHLFKYVDYKTRKSINMKVIGLSLKNNNNIRMF